MLLSTIIVNNLAPSKNKYPNADRRTKLVQFPLCAFSQIFFWNNRNSPRKHSAKTCFHLSLFWATGWFVFVFCRVFLSLRTSTFIFAQDLFSAVIIWSQRRCPEPQWAFHQLLFMPNKMPWQRKTKKDSWKIPKQIEGTFWASQCLLCEDYLSVYSLKKYIRRLSSPRSSFTGILMHLVFSMEPWEISNRSWANIAANLIWCPMKIKTVALCSSSSKIDRQLMIQKDDYKISPRGLNNTTLIKWQFPQQCLCSHHLQGASTSLFWRWSDCYILHLTSGIPKMQI